MLKIKQFEGKNGAVKNQFIIIDEENHKTIFQSYDSIIAVIDNKGKITLGKDWAYSVTTGKYRNQFLRESKKETQAKIDSGEYTIDRNL